MEYWAGQALLNFHEFAGRIGTHFQVSLLLPQRRLHCSRDVNAVPDSPPPVPLMLSPAEIVPQQPPQSELIFSVLNIPRLLQRKLISTQRSELTLPTVQNRHQTLPPRLDLGAILVNIFVGSEVRVGAGGCLLVFVVLLTWCDPPVSVVSSNPTVYGTQFPGGGGVQYRLQVVFMW